MNKYKVTINFPLEISHDQDLFLMAKDTAEARFKALDYFYRNWGFPFTIKNIALI